MCTITNVLLYVTNVIYFGISKMTEGIYADNIMFPFSTNCLITDLRQHNSCILIEFVHLLILKPVEIRIKIEDILKPKYLSLMKEK